MAKFVPTSATLYANLDAGWTDISDDVMGSIKCTWGITGNSPKDRVADTGIMTFRLNNIDGSYTPNGANVIDGWTQGINIKFIIVYNGDTYVRFYGTLNHIGFNVSPPDNIFIDCTVVDWINYASENPILIPALLTNKRGNEGINQLLAAMPIQPLSKVLDTGFNIFPSIFDLTRRKTAVMSEFARIADSELGFIYVKKDYSNGEQLVFENALHRSGLTNYAQLPLATTDTLLMETGDHLLLETGDKILLNYTSSATFSTFEGMNIQNGENTANRVVVTAYPRRVDTSVKVLYTLGSSMQIGNGETVTFHGNYTDPSGGASVGGFDMVEPVATTDYTVNTASDDSGTNLTSYAIVTVSFGANGAEITVKNTSTLEGFITFFQLRGKGIYTYNQTEYAEEDDNSIETNGYIERTFDQKYQAFATNTAPYVRTNLYFDRAPRTVLESIRFCANKSALAMSSFLNLDVGDMIGITENVVGLTGAYFIQSVDFEYQPGRTIWVTYQLVQHWSYLTGTSMPMIAEFSGVGYKEGIEYGYLPPVLQTRARTYSAWVNDYGEGYASPNNLNAYLSAPSSDGGGVVLLCGSASTHRIIVYTNLHNVNPGQWRTLDTNTVPPNTLTHIVVTYDPTSTSNDPEIYIDGVSKTVEETSTPSGTLNSEFGANIVIGNWHTNTVDYTLTWRGTVQDARIYDRILTSAEITTLYNSGTPDINNVTDGLVFQGPSGPKAIPLWLNNDDWDRITVGATTHDFFTENIYRAIGKTIADFILPT